jgi:hypothetical protein
MVIPRGSAFRHAYPKRKTGQDLYLEDAISCKIYHWSFRNRYPPSGQFHSYRLVFQATKQCWNCYVWFGVRRLATEQIMDLQDTLSQSWCLPDGKAYMFGDNESVITSPLFPIHPWTNDTTHCPIIEKKRQIVSRFVVFHISERSIRWILTKFCMTCILLLIGFLSCRWRDLLLKLLLVVCLTPRDSTAEWYTTTWTHPFI